MFWIQQYHRGGPVPAQSQLLFPHPSAYRRLGSGTSPAVRALRAVPLVEISSTPRSESPLARSTIYVSLDRSFARILCAYIDIRTIERAYARAYTCICTCSCICVSLHLFTCINANAVSYVRLRACVCVRACLRAELIKTQNAFARKIFQHANALWVQKLSGCTIHVHALTSCKFVDIVSDVNSRWLQHVLQINFHCCLTAGSQAVRQAVRRKLNQ